MTITATLDSGKPILVTIPARPEDGSMGLDVGQSSSPVWGLSGLTHTAHTLTIGSPDTGGSVYIDAFM
jgi:hypothetical protein